MLPVRRRRQSRPGGRCGLRVASRVLQQGTLSDCGEVGPLVGVLGEQRHEQLAQLPRVVATQRWHVDLQLARRDLAQQAAEPRTAPSCLLLPRRRERHELEEHAPNGPGVRRA